MTVTVETETRIARPAAAVFAALLDVERYPTWLIASGIRTVERLDPGPLQVGSGLRIAQSVAGRATTLEGRVTTLTPDTAFGLAGGDRDGVMIAIEAALGPDGEAAAGGGAATVLRWSVRIKLPLRYRMFESMVGPQAKRAAALDLEAFRRRLETEPTIA